jgi:hypothetical protein
VAGFGHEKRVSPADRDRSVCAPAKGFLETYPWIRREKGCEDPASARRLNSFDAWGGRNDPNCTVRDCRLGVRPLGLHKPL